MIIVKTSNGDVLINDRELVKLRHDKENHCVYVQMKGDGRFTFEHIKAIDRVETVTYINEETNAERKDEGSEVKYLRQQWANEKNMTGFLCTLAEGIEKKLLNFASDIIRMVQYGDDIPDEIRKRLRDCAEESKAWALDKGKWWERQEYLEKYQKQVEAEVAQTSMLNDKVDDQSAAIMELKDKLDSANRQISMYQSASERLMARSLWKRIINEKTWL